MDTSKVRCLAVDGDIIAYRTAAVCEEAFEGACNNIIDATFRDIATDTHIGKMRVYVSGEKNFRYNIAKTKPYKGNRVGMVRPQFLDHCKRYLIVKYNAIAVDGYEADDGIATDMSLYGSAHCGIDKDMLQIPGFHYNYTKKEWQFVTPEEAELTFWRQVLMGDTSDNIPGLPRVGAKTAEQVIYNHETAEIDAIDYYAQVCRDKMPGVNSIEYLAEQMQLIKMVRDVELDFTRFTIIEPNTEGFEAQQGEFTYIPPESKADPRL